jgi:hypothetical protein
MQEVRMLVSLSRPRSTQLTLFCLPNPKLNWQELSPETQEKVLRLLALFLRQQGTIVSAAPVAGEGADE